MENAIEELSHDHTASPDVINASESPREIHIGIYCRPDVNIITCEDTGTAYSRSCSIIFSKKVFPPRARTAEPGFSWFMS